MIKATYTPRCGVTYTKTGHIETVDGVECFIITGYICYDGSHQPCDYGHTPKRIKENTKGKYFSLHGSGTRNFYLDTTIEC